MDKPQTTHTPGPWEASERGDYADFNGNSQVITGDDMRVAVVQNSGHDWAFANARLIAAAPDLLAACKLAVAAMGNMDAARHIQTVIDKAEGRSA